MLKTFSALLIAGAFGCSLIVDASDVDAGCPDEHKFCGGACVEISDPAYGCTPTSCSPCTLLNAEPYCKDSICMVETCDYGFGCPVNSEGCKRRVLSDPFNCGKCGVECGDDQDCRNGDCVPDGAQ